jgi:hypothetical protein
MVHVVRIARVTRLQVAIAPGVPGAQPVLALTIRSDYVQATRSTRAGTLHERVLLACALARKNELGSFTAGAIREPLRVISGRRLDIPAFARHLAQFIEPERGAVLHREGEPRHYFYRFADPLLEPYIVLNGLAHDLISDDQLVALQSQPATTTADLEPSEPETLF